nr:hypothetical protein [Rickettsiales endosymbiont of Peranema trichophorum]
MSKCVRYIVIPRIDNKAIIEVLKELDPARDGLWGMWYINTKFKARES